MKSKYIIYRKLIILYTMSVLLLNACVMKTKSKQELINATIDFEVAIIETTGSKNHSNIKYFNKDLVLTNTDSLPYGTMGNIFYNPIIYNDKLYVIPQGLSNKKDLKKVVELQLDTGEINEYTIDQLAMNSLTVSNKYLYTCNTTNGVSYINQVNLENKKVSLLEIPEVYISKLMSKDDLLYAFGSMKDNTGIISYLYVIDSTLTITKILDISSSGTSQYKSIIIDDSLYFSNLTDKYDNPSNVIGIISLKDYSIINIELDNQYPSDLIHYHEYLVIAHCNLMTNEGNTISFYNLEDNKISSIQLNHPITQMNIKDDILYIIDGYQLYQYKIDLNQIPNITLLHQVELPCKKSTSDYYYVSGFYLNQ